MSDAYVRAMRNMRVRFGQPPRTFDRKDHSYLQVAPPDWAIAEADDLHVVYRDQSLLLEHGYLVWGALVQANSALFSEGDEDLPGVAIYAPQLHWGDPLVPLWEMTEKLFDLKSGGGSTPEERGYGALLADEMARGIGMKVPATIAGTGNVLSSSLMFFRKHMPGGTLANRVFPVIVHPMTKAIWMLPAHYWDSVVLDLWKERDDETQN